MALSISTIEPPMIVAGDTATWKKGLADYPADDGWTLTYSFVKSGVQFSATGVASGSDHLVTLAASTTAALDAGTYQWQAYVTKAAERYSVGAGTLELKTNYAARTSGFDARTTVKKTLDALNALIEGKATVDQQSTSVNGRAVTRLTPAELIEWRTFYKAEYSRELRAERIAAGLGNSSKVRIRFAN